MQNKGLYIFSLIAASLSPRVFAASATEVRGEGSYVRFQGQDRFDDMYATSFTASGEAFGESGSGNITQVTASGTFIRSGTPSTSSESESQVVSLERRLSLGVSHTLSQLSSIGVTAGLTSQSDSEAKNTFSRYYSLRLGQWWNKATLLTEFEAARSDSRQPFKRYTDTDGRAVMTPSRVEGNRYSLSLTWLATPQAMLMASLTRATAENRPDAVSGSLEGRYFFMGTLTAFHLKSTAYEDLGEVGRETDFGQISAREYEAQIHQHLSDRIIAVIVQRDHFEVEDPRSVEDDVANRHSKTIQGRLRYRFVTGPVTEMVPEMYVFFGQYNALDSDSKINHVGIGGTYVL